ETLENSDFIADLDVEEEMTASHEEYSQVSMISNSCSEQGLAYIAGFLAKKFKDAYPNLGKKTCDFGSYEETTSPWIAL
ncbi:Hypothetical protein FKW44_004785, partial [Caligus rogercresseyi]